LSANLNPISCADEANQNEAFLSVWMPNSSPSSPGGKHQLECLNERFIRSVTALRTLANRQMDLPGRAIFVWLGPGWPALRDPHFRPDDSTIKANLFQNLVTMTNALREAQVTLNLLSPASLFRKPEDLADPDETHFTFISKAEQVSAANLSLADLAWQSGGQVLENDKEMVDGIEACISDAQTYYQLSFDTPSAADFGELHSLAVRVDKPGLNVRASKLYYAEQ
jgi:VWFA-related protein